MKTSPYSKRKTKSIMGVSCMIAFTVCILYSFVQPKTVHLRHRQQEGWTKQSEKYILGIAYKAAAVFEFDQAQTHRFANCILGKYKKQFPKGLKSIPPDDLDDITKDIAKTCAAEEKRFFWPWNSQTTKLFRDHLNKMIESEGIQLTEKQKETWVACVIEKLKSKYPGGINPNEKTVQQVIEKISEYCASEALSANSQKNLRQRI